MIGFGLEVSRLCTGAERQVKLALRLSNRVFSWREMVDKIDRWGNKGKSNTSLVKRVCPGTCGPAAVGNEGECWGLSGDECAASSPCPAADRQAPVWVKANVKHRRWSHSDTSGFSVFYTTYVGKIRARL